MMKKLLLVFAAAVISAAASAQTSKTLTWGVEGGMNFNSLSLSTKMFESGNRAGFFVGPKVKVKVPLLGFGADAAVLYSLNGVNTERNGVSTSKNLSYLEIPLNVRYSFGLKVVSVYLATGPQYNYCMSGDKAIGELFGGQLKSDFSRSTWGWNVGAGVEVMSHLQIGVSYTIPVSDSSDLNFSDALGAMFTPGSYKQKTVKVRLAYMF